MGEKRADGGVSEGGEGRSGASSGPPPSKSAPEGGDPPAPGGRTASPPGASGPEASGPGPSGPGGRSVAAGDLERVIRRASDLQFRGGEGGGSGGELDEAELVRIGGEVGLEPHYVRQALAEVRAESLLPDLPDESELATRLWGSGLIRASRAVPGAPADVESRLEGHLRDVELLKRVRSRPGRSLWEPAGGLLPSMRRAMNVGGHGYRLAQARSLELVVDGLEEGWSLVTMIADIRNERAGLAAGWHLGLLPVGLGAAIFLVATGGPELPILLGSGLAGGGAAGGATWATAQHFRRRRERTGLALEGLLDRLERGEPLSPARTSWRDRIEDLAPDRDAFG